MEQLDESQLAFCRDPATHLRLLAPAGCGKTLSLLFRCRYLAGQNKTRQRFLIVTFTVAANQELRARLNEDERFAAIRDSTDITTLNSWGFRRIRNAAFSPKLITTKTDYHFAVLNQLQPVWRNHESVGQAIAANRFIAPRKLMDAIDTFKSIGFDHVRHVNYEQFSERLREVRDHGLGWKIAEQLDELTKLGVLESKIAKTGQEVAAAGDRELYNAFFRFWRDASAHLIENATFTLEDQKYFAYLDERQKVEDGSFLSGAARSDHVLVDEFQDINPLDLSLIKAIVDRNRATVTVVGDDDQAIFEWRGATPEYILNPDRFLGSKFSTHTLAMNYRSPKNVVDLSQRLIRHNQRRVDKDIHAYHADEAKIEVIQTDSLTGTLDRVYAEVQRAVGKGESPSRVAIIGRKRSQIIPYQVFFASRDVSFCAAEDLQVFMSDAFERLLRLLMIKERAGMRQTRSQVVDDLLELCNLVKRYPLKKSDRESLRRHLQQCGAATLISALDALALYADPLKGTNANRSMSISFADAIREYIEASTVSDALMALAAKFDGLQVDLGKAEDDIFFADPPFFHLAEYASRYDDDYGRFIDDIERAKDQLVYLPPFEDDSQPATPEELWKRPLHLMTALRAKGKEFDSVILLDVNDGIWPNRNARTPEQLEAERRVFYVAFTRARKSVLITLSSRLGSRVALPSPYIEELGLRVDREGTRRTWRVAT